MTDSLSGFHVHEQGHIHVELVSTLVARPGLRRWYVQTEQKYIDGVAITDGPDATIALWAVDDLATEGRKTLNMRAGEDGSEQTHLTYTLPRTLPWREWLFDVETARYGLCILAWTEATFRETWYRQPLAWAGWVLRNRKARGPRLHPDLEP